ncbi:hypothetical protein C8R43DRAFT_1141803 [Mycena crocata]|nr:hypothetical protein C8R43DRAFT_1141803 [Mycena crocata]
MNLNNGTQSANGQTSGRLRLFEPPPCLLRLPLANARNDALFERARENPDRFELIQSRIANGRALQAILSVVTGNLWEGGDAEARLSLAVAEADGQDTDMDGVDLMMTRTALNRLIFLIHADQKPAF